MKNKLLIGVVALLLIIIMGFMIYKSNHFKPVELINMNELDIKYNKDKPNIYLFYKIGCPHCEALAAYLSTIDNKYYQIYTFETSKDSKNKDLMKKVIEETNDEGVTGVPYLIVGENTFNGFTESMKETIKEKIIDNYDKKLDIYKKIKEAK